MSVSLFDWYCSNQVPRCIVRSGVSRLGRRQLRDQPQRHRQPFELVVRAQEELRRVVARDCPRLPRPTTSAAASGLRALVSSRRVRRVAVDVVHDPVLQPALHVVPFLERADLVAHDALQVVRKAAAREQVRQPRRQVGVGGRVGVVVLGGLLQRLRADERGEVGVLAVHQRHEAVLGQLGLAPVVMAISVGHFMSTPPSSVGKVCAGRPSTAPPDSMPRMREHQPYSLNERLMLTAIA